MRKYQYRIFVSNLKRGFESKCYSSQSEAELGTYNYCAMVGKADGYWNEVEFFANVLYGQLV